MSHRHLIVDIMRERLVKAFGIFIGTWLVGAFGFWCLGRFYGVNHELILPDGSVDHTNYSFLNCMYLAAMTASTLGMADMNMLNRIPGEGRNFVYAFMIVYALISYLMVVYATAQIVSYVVEGALTRYLERRRMERDLSSLSRHYVVCGLGSTGHHIVQELIKVDTEVVGIDVREETIAANRRAFPEGLFFEGDGTDDEVLKKAGVERAQGLFCALPEDKDNIIAVLTARQLNPAMKIVARASQLANVQKLKQVGANITISPNHIGGMRMASEMLRPAVTTFLDTMLRSRDATVRFENVTVRAGSRSAGRPIGELGIHSSLGLVVVATVKPNGDIRYNPGASTVLEGGDSVVVIASPEQKRALDAHLNGSVA